MNFEITIKISPGAISALPMPSRTIYRYKEFTQVHHDEYFATETVSVLTILYTYSMVFPACILYLISGMLDVGATSAPRIFFPIEYLLLIQKYLKYQV